MQQRQRNTQIYSLQETRNRLMKLSKMGSKLEMESSK